MSVTQGGRRLPRPRQFFNPRQTAAIYEDPATGWREGVPHLAWLWLLLFGGFYLAARMVWRPMIFMAIVILISLLIFGLFALVVMIGFWILASTQAQRIFREHYLRKGWYEIDPWEQDEHGTHGLM
ncbi:hypothetical protein [Sphingomonas sp. CLY1604]|uniref:hypothetical protein n=1 Tax=Sphingomonas sp. CLY1604 TaxID=3457786 RepID=UPI003FD82C61